LGGEGLAEECAAQQYTQINVCGVEGVARVQSEREMVEGGGCCGRDNRINITYYNNI